MLGSIGNVIAPEADTIIASAAAPTPVHIQISKRLSVYQMLYAPMANE
jgi:hypothetical protein